MVVNGDKHLLFISKPGGYELREADGDAPAVGTLVEVDDLEELVIKVGPSPLQRFSALRVLTSGLGHSPR